MRIQRKDVHDPDHAVSARIVVPEIDVEVVRDALGGDQVVRLVAGRGWSDLEKDEQVDRERDREGDQSRQEGPEPEELESGPDAPEVRCLSLLLDSRASPTGSLTDAEARARRGRVRTIPSASRRRSALLPG